MHDTRIDESTAVIEGTATVVNFREVKQSERVEAFTAEGVGGCDGLATVGSWVSAFLLSTLPYVSAPAGICIVRVAKYAWVRLGLCALLCGRHCYLVSSRRCSRLCVLSLSLGYCKLSRYCCGNV